MQRILLILLLSAGLAACDMFSQEAETATTKNAADAAPEAEEEVLIPVEVTLPERRDMAAYIETNGKVLAERRVEVLSQGTGICDEVRFEEGDRVSAGDVLAWIETRELEAQIGQAQVNVRQQKAAFDLAERMLEEGIGSKVDRDNARFAYEQALSSLELQQVQLENQTIEAPISGIVTRRMLQEGMLVSAGMAVCSIVDPSSYMLPISPTEKELGRLEAGQQAQVTLDALPGQSFTATVARINPSVDASGTVEVMLSFPADVRSRLREGAFARVNLVTEVHEDALTIPKDSVIEDHGRRYVMLVRKATEAEMAELRAPRAQDRPEGLGNEPMLVAQRQDIEGGLENSSYLEVVDGLDESDLVVTLGQHTLKSGTPVVITNVEDQLTERADISIEAVAAQVRKERLSRERK